MNKLEELYNLIKTEQDLQSKKNMLLKYNTSSSNVRNAFSQINKIQKKIDKIVLETSDEEFLKYNTNEKFTLDDFHTMKMAANLIKR